MGSTRRKFTQEYKAEAVELVINSGRPVAEVARNLGINEGTLGNWLNHAKKDGSITEKPLSVSERELGSHPVESLNQANHSMTQQRAKSTKKPASRSS